MPVNSYQTCEKIIAQLKDKGFYEEVPVKEIVDVISRIAGTDPRTRAKYLQDLKKFGFVKPKGYGIFIIIGGGENEEKDSK